MWMLLYQSSRDLAKILSKKVCQWHHGRVKQRKRPDSGKQKKRGLENTSCNFTAECDSAGDETRLAKGALFVFWVIKNIIIIFLTVSFRNVRTLCSLCSLTFTNPSTLPAALITQTCTAMFLSHAALSTHLKQWADCCAMNCCVY